MHPNTLRHRMEKLRIKRELDFAACFRGTRPAVSKWIRARGVGEPDGTTVRSSLGPYLRRADTEWKSRESNAPPTAYRSSPTKGYSPQLLNIVEPVRISSTSLRRRTRFPCKFSHLHKSGLKLKAKFRCPVARHAICSRATRDKFQPVRG
jgi:hypothetical protein